MTRMTHTLALLAAVGAVACGATTRDPEPVYTPTTAGPQEIGASERGVVPVGQELDVRLQTTLSSATAEPEQRFEATTVVDVTQGGQVLIPAGSVVRGVVTRVERAGNIDRDASLTLSFDQITVRGRQYPLRGMATQVFERGGVREQAGTVGAGAGVGAIVGGILGGVQGAAIGAAVGAGGVVAATEGENVELPAGSIVRIRLDSPLRLY